MYYVFKYIYIHPLALSTDRLRSNDTPGAMSTPNIQALVSKYHSSIKKKKQSSLEKGLNPGTGQASNQMSLEYLVVPERKK